MTDLIQHKIIRCKDSPYMPECMTCTREFESGEDRHEWRTYLLYRPETWDEDSYRKCGYWVTNCHECYVKNMVMMRDNINEQLGSMPDRMRNLA